MDNSTKNQFNNTQLPLLLRRWIDTELRNHLVSVELMLFKAKELAAEHKIEGFEVTLEWLEGFCRQQNWKIFFTDDENVARAPNQAGGCSEVKPTGVKEHNKSNDETSRDWPNWCRFCGSLGKTVQISEEFVALVNKFVNTHPERVMLCSSCCIFVNNLKIRVDKANKISQMFSILNETGGSRLKISTLNNIRNKFGLKLIKETEHNDLSDETNVKIASGNEVSQPIQAYPKVTLMVKNNQVALPNSSTAAAQYLPATRNALQSAESRLNTSSEIVKKPEDAVQQTIDLSAQHVITPEIEAKADEAQLYGHDETRALGVSQSLNISNENISPEIVKQAEDAAQPENNVYSQTPVALSSMSLSALEVSSEVSELDDSATETQQNGHFEAQDVSQSLYLSANDISSENIDHATEAAHAGETKLIHDPQIHDNSAKENSAATQSSALVADQNGQNHVAENPSTFTALQIVRNAKMIRCEICQILILSTYKEFHVKYFHPNRQNANSGVTSSTLQPTMTESSSGFSQSATDSMQPMTNIETPKLKCPWCDQEYKSNSGLNSHKCIKHPIESMQGEIETRNSNKRPRTN